MNCLNKIQSNNKEIEKLNFFNYHEYSSSLYNKLNQSQPNQNNTNPLIITHFPNNYVPLNSNEYLNTRIVRIPRIFNNIKGLEFPEFSTVLPGNEDAAIISSNIESNSKVKEFIIQGQSNHDGQYYGYTSISPLNLYFNNTDNEFEIIMVEINRLIKNSYNTFTLWNFLEYFIDLIGFWLISEIWEIKSKNQLNKLETYIENLNKSWEFQHRNIKIISPRRSGYLSVSFLKINYNKFN
ncbi:hypothetical protein WICMUC_003076 [Wickerhamomyces mucosus]|uniref:Ras modification protein ERF4 n=1 Tax=Wickerhamomyces mucosus TaxID=1378264 RepID=A0A9P8PMF0_9ASCO|nr:hypothetical protein WICMUC_003076 [Wickerhamomyces mucosus]